MAFLENHKRYVQISLLFAAGFLAYTMRADLSVGILAMMADNPPDPSIPTYPNWTLNDKDNILSSFFWGYVIFQIGAGQIGEKYGPKYFLTVAIIISSIFTMLVPFMASQYDITGVLISRVIVGLSQGFLFPSSHCILSKWTPLEERSRIAGFVYTAGPLGTAAAMLITSYISDSKLGWPFAFYFFGALGIVWALAFLFFGHNSPSEHPTVTSEEKKYIQQGSSSSKETRLKTPWKSILTSSSVWAIVIAHVGNNWGFWTLLTEIPSYMQDVLNFSLKDNGLLSAVPYVAYGVLSFIMSPISDKLITSGTLSLGRSRKIFNTLGLLLPAICLISLGYVPKDQKILAIALLILAVGTNACCLVGFNVNHIDISPNFAGTLMGITNCAANFASIVGPLSVKVFVTEKGNVSQWRIVFIIAAVIYAAAAAVFVIFSSGEVQPWNEPKHEDDKKISVIGSSSNKKDLKDVP